MARGIEYGRADIRLAAAVAGLATTQTIGWGTTYFLPAVIAEEIMADLLYPAPVRTPRPRKRRR